MEETTVTETVKISSGLPRKARILIGAAAGILIAGGLALVMNANREETDETDDSDDTDTTDTPTA